FMRQPTVVRALGGATKHWNTPKRPRPGSRSRGLPYPPPPAVMHEITEPCSMRRVPFDGNRTVLPLASRKRNALHAPGPPPKRPQGAMRARSVDIVDVFSVLNTRMS